jgi:hypothetical protein
MVVVFHNVDEFKAELQLEVAGKTVDHNVMRVCVNRRTAGPEMEYSVIASFVTFMEVVQLRYFIGTCLFGGSAEAIKLGEMANETVQDLEAWAKDRGLDVRHGAHYER